MSDKTFCYLVIQGSKNPFWVDQKCTPGRIRRCLFDTLQMDPATTHIKLDGKELTEEKPVVQMGVVHGSILEVTYCPTMRMLNQTLGVGGKIDLFKNEKVSEACQVCGMAPPTYTFALCGHRCICVECMEKKLDRSCPVCQHL